MIREALKRKDKVSAREQLYIDAMAAQVMTDPLTGKDGDSDKAKKILEKLVRPLPR
jgi:hypothetical protein